MIVPSHIMYLFTTKDGALRVQHHDFSLGISP